MANAFNSEKVSRAIARIHAGMMALTFALISGSGVAYSWEREKCRPTAATFGAILHRLHRNLGG